MINNILNSNIRSYSMNGFNNVVITYTGDGTLVSASSIDVLTGTFDEYSGQLFTANIEYADNTSESGHVIFSNTKLSLVCRDTGKTISRFIANIITK